MSDVSEELRAILHAKENLCAQLAALPDKDGVEDYAGEIAALCAAYSASGTVPPEYSELLDKKFSEALECAKKGADVFEARKQQIAGLSGEVNALVAAGDFVTLDEIAALEKKIASLGASAEILEPLAPVKARLQAEADAEKAVLSTYEFCYNGVCLKNLCK